MTFVAGVRIAETAQRRRMVFITGRNDNLSTAARTCKNNNSLEHLWK